MDLYEEAGKYKTFEEFYEANKQYLGGMQMSLVERFYNVARQQYLSNQTGDYQALLGSIASNEATMSPEYEKWLDNGIANQRTLEDRVYQTEMRDSSLTSAAQQLSSLGLSTSNVIQTGGASSGVSSAASAQNMHSTASLRQQERINNFNQKMGLVKSLVGAAGSMASSGIYGAALGAIKNASAKIATSAAHSGLNVLSKWNGYGNGPLVPKQDSGPVNNADGYLL